MPWVKNRFGATVWEPDEKEDVVVADPTPSPKKKTSTKKTSPRVQKTNQYGGPAGTKRDASGYALSDPRHVANRGKSTAKGAKRSSRKKGPKYVSGGESSSEEKARLAAAEAQAQKAAEEAARKAAEAALRERIEKKAAKRGEKFASQLKARQDAIEAQRRENEGKIRAINNSLTAVAKTGDKEAAASLNETRMSLLLQNEHLQKKYDDNRRGFNRIQAGNRFRQQVNDIRANQALDDVQKRRRLRNLKDERRAEKRAAIKASSIPSVAKAVYGKTRPGQTGYGKVVKKAVADLTAMQIADPDNFDPEALNYLGQQLVRHERKVAAGYDEFVKGYESDVALLDPKSKTAAKPGSQKWIRARNRMLKRFDEYNVEDTRREFRFLYGPKSKTNIKGTDIPKPHKKGLFNYFAAASDAAFDAAEKRAREVLFGTGLVGLVNETAHRVQTAVYLAAAEKTRHNVKDPLTGETRKQTQQERLNEMFQQGAMSRQEAQQVGQEQFRDFEREALEVRDSPTLPHLYNLFEEEGIKTNADLTGTFAIEKLESRLIPKAIDTFMEDFRNGPDYRVPGEAEGIFDASRYGSDEGGEFFLLADGTKVRMGDPLPEGHPNPLWGHSEDVGLSTQIARGISWAVVPVGALLTVTGNEINISDTYSRAYDHAVSTYESNLRQRAEDDFRAALRIEDPGFLGEVFRTNPVGEILSTFDAVPGAVALAWTNYNQALTGVNRPAGQDAPFMRSDEFANYIKANADKYASDEYYFEQHTSEAQDPVGAFFTAIGFTASRAVSIDPETQRATMSLMVSVPVVGPMEFVWEVGEAADAQIADMNVQADKAFQNFMETGDIGVYARTLGTNEIYQFGNMAGVANFAFYLLADPSNFIPGITLGKKGLSAVRGALAAGRAVPPGTGKLARLVEGFRGLGAGFRTDVKAADAVVRMTKDFEGLMPQASRADIMAGLSRARAGIDDAAPQKTRVRELAKQLEQQFGLKRLGLDTKQVHQIAEQHAHTILARMDWSIYTQADEAAEHVTKMENTLNLIKGESRAIEDARMARNDRVVEMLAKEGQQARRDAAEVRKATENFESAALDVANRYSAKQLERLTRQARTADSRRLYQRALELRAKRDVGVQQIDELGPTGDFVKKALDNAAADADIAAKRAAKRKAGRVPRREAASAMERKKLRDIELREDAAQARAQRLADAQTRRIERRIAAETEKVERLDAARKVDPTTRLVDRVQPLTRGIFHRAIPRSWSDAKGPSFWNGLVGRTNVVKAPRAAVQDALAYVRGTAVRYGRFHIDDAGTAAFMRKVGGDVLANPAAMRRIFRQLAEEQGFIQFGDTLNAAGNKLRVPSGGEVSVAVQHPLFGQVKSVDEFIDTMDDATLFAWLDDPVGMDTWTRLLLNHGGDVLDNRDMTALFLMRQQYFAATADEAITYLKAVGNDGIYDKLVRDMFEADFNDWRAFAGDFSLNIRDEVFQQFREMPIARLDEFLNPPLKRNEELFSLGGFAMRPGAPVVGFEGFDLNAAFKELDKAIGFSGDLGPQQARTLDTLVRAALYQSITADDWTLARTLSHTLATAGNKSKAGRLARAMRQRMFRELEIMGIEPQGVLYRIGLNDLPTVPKGETRVFRGYDGRAGKGPFTVFSTGGRGGRVFGDGLYVTPDFPYAAGYAAFYAAQTGYGQVSSLRVVDDVLMDLRPFTDNLVQETQDILARAAGAGSNASAVPSPQAVRAARLMDEFLTELRTNMIKEEALRQGGAVTADIRNAVNDIVNDLTINKVFGDDSKFNLMQKRLDNYIKRKGLKGYNYDSTAWKRPEGGPPDAPGERAMVFRETDGVSLEELSVVDNAPPRPQEVATRQAQALMNEMGMSEEAWLRNRITRNDSLRNNPKVGKLEAQRLSRENDLMRRALEDIQVQKSGGTYKPPAMSFDEAVRGAESVRARVAGRTPPKIFAFFARNSEQAQVETYRAVYQASRETPTNGQRVKVVDDFLDNFDMRNYDEVHRAVTQKIQEVQGRRAAKLGERKPIFEESPDDFLHSLNDKDPEVLAAKRQALQEMSDKFGVQISVNMYDRMRTMLNGHIQRGVRADAIAQEARALSVQTGGDFDQIFLELRMAKTDEDAVQTIRQMLLRHPGMTPEEAARQFELSYIQDGVLRKPRKQVTDSDIRILEAYFEAKAGKKVTDRNGVIEALARADTKPDYSSRQLFRSEAVRKGDWAPRKAEDIDQSRPTWSIDEEREFFMNRYGDAPAWTTADALKHGGDAFISREVMYRTMLETGNYDETVRIQRALGEVEYANLDDLAFGRKGPDGEWIVRPSKDIERERLWMVQRYGDRVGQVNADGSVTLHAAPWLMNKVELQQFMRSIPDTKKGLLGDLIRNADELDEFYAAVDRVTEKHVKAWVRASGITDQAEMAIPSSVLHRIAFDVVQEISATTPWRRFFTKFRNRNLVDAWGWFWRAVVVSNPAFVVSNIIDTPTKGLYFALTNRWSQKASKEAIEALPDIRALGVENTAYFHQQGRSFLQRMGRESYGPLDRAGALADLFTTSLAANTLQPVERATKLRVARRIFTGMMDEIGEALYAGRTSDKRLADIMQRTNPEFIKRLKGDRELVKEFILLETRREILRLFPTLDTAGPVERFINKLMPFISYNFKNRMLWMGEVVEHPWMLYVIAEAQEGLKEYNRQWWEQDHPGERMPEHLFDQIRIPGTDMFIDLGMFTDSARGAELLFQHDRAGAPGIGEVLSTLIRPLPAQRAFIAKAFYDMFNIGGRYRWERVFDENGLWDGKTYRQVQIPPGTPWGEKPLDYLRDFLWTPAFIDSVTGALEDGTLTYEEAVRSFGVLISFGEFAEPSKYFMTIQKYFMLPDQASRDAFLATEEGQWLKEHWDQEYWEPTDTASSPFAFNYESGAPTPDEVRKRWLNNQSPEARERFFDGWAESQALQEYWDAELDGAKNQAERNRLYALRRTDMAQFYHERPWLWQYAGMGMTPEEFDEFQGKMRIDEQREVFFDVWGYDKAPEDAKERAQWEVQRAAWLEANPALRADLEAVKDSYDRSIVERNERWDKLISLGQANNRIRDIGYKRDDPVLVEATDGLREFIGDGFRMEAFGYDKDREQYRVKADSLTSKLRRAAGDQQAIQDALYSQRMEAVWEKAGDDPLKFHNILDRNKDLRALYFQRNPDKRLTWKQDGKYLEFWGRMGRLADKGRWDQYWDSWDAAPSWVQERFRESNPSKYRKFVQSARYSDYMGRWVGMFDTHGAQAAMEYFHSLPNWAKERYYENHPGKRFSASGGRGFVYVGTLNQMFDQIDAGNWDRAEAIWNSAPAWVRRRYYANNPDSTLFRGQRSGGTGGYSRGSGGGISDAKYKQYVQGMKQWVNLLRDGKDDEAVRYFQSLPQWMQDFYVRNNPDKALIKEDMKMQALLQDYFLADRANQQAMLKNNPRLAKWLNENDTQTARRNAINYMYSQLPDDPWLKRVYREKYPEVFGKEAVGRQRRRAVLDTLNDHPEFRGAWEEWLEDIYSTLQEAMKYMTARPKSPEVDHSRMRRRGYRGMSAEEVSERVDRESKREWKLDKRAPKPEG